MGLMDSKEGSPCTLQKEQGNTKGNLSWSAMLLATVLLGLASFICQENVLALGSSVFPRAASTIVDTGYVKYQGNHSLAFPNNVAFLGIPYAEPPLGERRFRAPLPLNKARVALESKGKVVDARSYPNFCIQGTTGGGDAGGAGTEDCLKVNIYTPLSAKKGSNLPVLVYIHGGGYVFGNPANWPFEHWVNQSPNVVIVSVYYRLSSFGFLATPAMGSPVNGDLNAGFLDQVQALKWVKENIASFGGNPSQVTINGESAGGSSIELHLVANEGEKLFSGAIAQSVYRTPLPTVEQQQDLFAFYANHAGCGSGTDAAKLACLRKASVSALARAQDAATTSAFTASGYNLFHPVIDNKLFSEFPTKSILEGKFANVPLIVGATSNETLSGGTDIAAALKSFFPSIRDQDIAALVAAYPVEEFGSSLQFQTVTGDAELRCARSLMATAFGKKTNSWTYRYNERTPGASAVFHAAENYVMFRGTSTGFNGTTTFNDLTPAESAFAEELIAYWLSFVRSGDPNKFKLGRSPFWVPFTAQKARIVLQAIPAQSNAASGSSLEKESDEETTRCTLIVSQADVQEN